jgi:hypothetical protein
MIEGGMIGLIALSKYFKKIDIAKTEKINDILFVKD